MDKPIHLPDTICTFDTLCSVLKKQGYTVYKDRRMESTQIGRLAEGMSLSDIARKHGVTTLYLQPEFERGTKHEFEHTTDKKVAESIALDHLFENPRYYTMLEAREKDAEKTRKKIELPQELKSGGTTSFDELYSAGGATSAKNAQVGKKQIFAYWQSQERKNKNEYCEYRLTERDTTLMGEEAQRHFGVATESGNTPIEQDIFEWAVDYDRFHKIQ